MTLAPSAHARHDDDLKEAAVQYLAGHEPQLKETTDPIKRWALLGKLAPAAMFAGDMEKAGRYARELMALGEKDRSQPGFGYAQYSQAAHIGNLVLGHIALAQGDIGKAKEHLLAAGRVDGSPVLKSFGPSMMLAKELIEKGEQEAVIEYFDLCARFWDMQGDKLEGWKAIVRNGGTPDFRWHLGGPLTAWRGAR